MQHKELLPIISAYYGCIVSYEFTDYTLGKLLKSRELNSHVLDFLESKSSQYSNFKLHLRPLWSITEEELRELANALEWYSEFITYVLRETHFKGQEKIIRYEETNFYISIEDDNTLSFCVYFSAKIINYLRKKSFCLDPELVDAGLVQWIEQPQSA